MALDLGNGVLGHLPCAQLYFRLRGRRQKARESSILPIEHIHTYLVHPGKGADAPPQIGGTTVPLEGKLFGLLNRVRFLDGQ